MAKRTPHPYVTSSGPLVQTFSQFRKAMPAAVDANTLKKFSLAPNNEAPVLSVFRYLGFVDTDGKKTPEATKVFSKHNDDDFAKALEPIVRKTYSDLFDQYGDVGWTTDRDTLIAFFRSSDDTSAITGKRQAVAFETLAALSGHGELRQPAKGVKTAKKTKATKKTSRQKAGGQSDSGAGTNLLEDGGRVGLTVRIEINLPAQGDQETYDRIFQSIRKNLLNG